MAPATVISYQNVNIVSSPTLSHMAAHMAALPPQVQRHTGADYEAGRVHRRNIIRMGRGAGHQGPGISLGGTSNSGRPSSRPSSRPSRDVDVLFV
jgi:hypothetical protein